jgi:hypothetical protein
LPSSPFRLCVDLNVWIGNFLAIANGLRGTASQFIIDAIQNGRSGVGPIQLIVSHTMLSRLVDVLMRKGAGLDSAAQFISLIEHMSRLGPSCDFPHVVLGGGFFPTQDARMQIRDPYDPAAHSPPYDPEDGRVIDTAIAARAHALVTANLRDFTERHDTVISPGRVHIRHTANHELYVVHPKEMVVWLRTGNRPTRLSPSNDA